MKRARQRKHNPLIPNHIDQAALPAAIYFDARNAGVWYTLHRDGDGKQRRKNVAPAETTLAELHQIMEQASGTARGTLRWVCEQYEDSAAYKRLQPKTQSGYIYSRDILLNTPTKLKKALGDLVAERFTPALVQALIDRLANDGTPSKAAHVLRYLRRVLGWARTRGHVTHNPAAGLEAPIERKRRRLPAGDIMDMLIDRARAYGRLGRGVKNSCPEYLASVMELSYLCRLRGIETITLTDANELETGILTNRRKGSRDNIVRWTPRLRTAWNDAKAYRQRVWEDKAMPAPAQPSRRYIVVAAHGGRLQKSSLDSAWQRFIQRALDNQVITEDERFGLHDLKRRGITDTAGTRADKQQASGHRDAQMLDVYDLSVPTVDPSVL